MWVCQLWHDQRLADDARDAGHAHDLAFVGIRVKGAHGGVP